MVKRSKFYGLRGLGLNIAIAIVAGTDFALFGYDQVRVHHATLGAMQRLTKEQRVSWAVC